MTSQTNQPSPGLTSSCTHFTPEGGTLLFPVSHQPRSLTRWHQSLGTTATELYVYRLRNYKDLETLVEELSALYDRKTLHQLYNIATDEPHSFLYINLMAKDKKDMFFVRFDHKLIVEDNDDLKR